MIAALVSYGSDLEYMPEKLRADKEVILAALAPDRHPEPTRSASRALQFASCELKADREVVLAVVR